MGRAARCWAARLWLCGECLVPFVALGFGAARVVTVSAVLAVFTGCRVVGSQLVSACSLLVCEQCEHCADVDVVGCLGDLPGVIL